MIWTRAQGTIEYLLIISIVLVICLALVGIITSSEGGLASSVSSTANKLNQATNSISVSDVVVDKDGNGIITFANNSGENLNINRLSFDGVDSFYNFSFFQGDKKSFSFPIVGDNCKCLGFTGQQKKCLLKVYATSDYGVQKTFPVTIAADCVIDATAVNPTLLVNPLPDPFQFWVFDINGLLWSPDRGNVNWRTADLNCVSIGSKVSTLSELQNAINTQLTTSGPPANFAEGIYFWSSDPDWTTNYYVAGDVLGAIDIGTTDKTNLFHFRCVK